MNFPQGFTSPALMAALMRKWMQGANPAIEKAAIARGLEPMHMPAEDVFQTGEAVTAADAINRGEMPNPQMPVHAESYQRHADRLREALQRYVEGLQTEMQQIHPNPNYVNMIRRKISDIQEEVAAAEMAGTGFSSRAFRMSGVAPLGAGAGQQLGRMFDQESAARTAARQRAETQNMEGTAGMVGALFDPLTSALQGALSMPGQGGYAPPTMNPYKAPRAY